MAHFWTAKLVSRKSGHINAQRLDIHRYFAKGLRGISMDVQHPCRLGLLRYALDRLQSAWKRRQKVLISLADSAIS